MGSDAGGPARAPFAAALGAAFAEVSPAVRLHPFFGDYAGYEAVFAPDPAP